MHYFTGWITTRPRRETPFVLRLFTPNHTHIPHRRYRWPLTCTCIQLALRKKEEERVAAEKRQNVSAQLDNITTYFVKATIITFGHLINTFDNCVCVFPVVI